MYPEECLDYSCWLSTSSFSRKKNKLYNDIQETFSLSVLTSSLKTIYTAHNNFILSVIVHYSVENVGYLYKSHIFQYITLQLDTNA
jgi:hypothetical protein